MKIPSPSNWCPKQMGATHPSAYGTRADPLHFPVNMLWYLWFLRVPCFTVPQYTHESETCRSVQTYLLYKNTQTFDVNLQALCLKERSRLNLYELDSCTPLAIRTCSPRCLLRWPGEASSGAPTQRPNSGGSTSTLEVSKGGS